jgi:hypothetical protein
MKVGGSAIEMIVEADGKEALARGMQGFQVSAARWLNKEARRSGGVFVDRYWMKVMRTRAEVRGVIGGIAMVWIAWPQTWLGRVEVVRGTVGRKWMRTRADEDS